MHSSFRKFYSLQLLEFFRLQLVFEAQRGNGELSDIAIDDIYFDQHKCPPHEQGREFLMWIIFSTAKFLCMISPMSIM